ncbi:MAG: RidA family protein [Christensenellales bacterium]
MIRIIETNLAPKAVGPYSQAVALGTMVYTSGQIALNPETGLVEGSDITAQTARVLKNLRAVLEAAGTSVEKVVKTTCFLQDMADFVEFNAVYETVFTHKPARSCVAVRALPKGVLVEVEAIAAL